MAWLNGPPYGGQVPGVYRALNLNCYLGDQLKRIEFGATEELKMVTFQLIGMALAALFFGALVTGNPDVARR